MDKVAKSVAEALAPKRRSLGCGAPTRSAEGIRNRAGPEPAGTCGSGPCWVRSRRQTTDNSGHQTFVGNRRSSHLQPPDLIWRRRVQWSSSLPTRLPRALRALAHEAVVTEDGPHPEMAMLAFTRQRPPPAKASSGQVRSLWGQQHQRDLAAGLVLVGAIALVHFHKAGEQPAALGRVGGPGGDGQVLGADLDLGPAGGR
jgi:hypothetical protein